jgi:hypothetical protein
MPSCSRAKKKGRKIENLSELENRAWIPACAGMTKVENPRNPRNPRLISISSW